MGNVQTSSIANQLLPFESYISDPGITRFMKVARVEHAKGPIVVKVFVFSDQFCHVEFYRDQLQQIGRRLLSHPNCAPFSHIYLTARSAILCRPFSKFTLYDRLSTRPFLSTIEKRWIAFQLLKAFAQLRIAMIRHGDIKSQNVLVSSSLWIKITDFAPFKPAFLPYNNPSDFTFFFDTSRRRFCYLAPERFKDNDELLMEANRNYGNNEFINFYEGLTEAMDIFALGCLFVELFTDGRQVAFNLPQAIDYKLMNDESAEIYLKRLLSHISEQEFVPLIKIMLDRNPKRRREEFLKLSPCSSYNLFPPIFEKYLYNYFKELQEQPTPDALITKLYVERDNFISMIRDLDCSSVSVLFINYVCVSLRSCQSLTSKMDAISLLHQLSKICTPVLVFERIILYLANSLTDYFALVRAEALLVLGEILCSVETIPPEECRLLDFIFPKFKLLLNDPSNLVKIALASNLGKFAQLAKRFFELNAARLRSDSPEQQSQKDSNISQLDPKAAFVSPPLDMGKSSTRLEVFLSNEKQHLIETEYKSSQDAITELFVTLCGSENEVRRCIFEARNLDLLCQFFGSSRIVDVLLHMISLLNDKNDWRIRSAFYEACPILAKHLGQNRTSKLKPFLLSGLQDSEEFVVIEAFRCIYLLLSQQLLSSSVIFNILPDVVPFLIHPNKWLRVIAVNILTVLESSFSIADIYCKLVPLLQPFLKEQLIRLNCFDLIYETLEQPISRQIWDLLLKEHHSFELISAIEERKTVEKLGGGNDSYFSSLGSLSANIKNNRYKIDSLMRKIKNTGSTDERLDIKLIAFKHLFGRIEKSKRRDRIEKYLDLSRINLNEIERVNRKVFDLERGVHRKGRELTSSHFFVDQFGAQHVMLNTSELIEPANVVDLNDANHSALNQRVLDESSERILLEETLRHKQERYSDQKRITTKVSESNSEIAERIAAAAIEAGTNSEDDKAISSKDDLNSRQRILRSTRRLNIRMLAHLHEHSGKITRLASHSAHDYIASAGVDKSVKIWSSSLLQNQSQPASMSLDTFRYSHPINSCSFMGDRGNHLVMACADASLQLFDIERKHLIKSVQLNRQQEGPITDLYSFEHLIYALTHHSSVFCYDLRVAPKKGRNAIDLSSVWQHRVKNSYGLITSFCIDSSNQQWMLLTASSATTKNMLLWDLRFAGLEVATWSHPSDRIIPLRSWHLSNHRVITNCTRESELSLWDISSQSRSDVLWPSVETPLVYKNEIVSSAVAPSLTDRENIIFSGDSEGSLRAWNLSTPSASTYLCGPYRRHLPILESISDLQQIKTPMIYYKQIKCQDNALKIHVEDRSQLLAQTDGSEEQQMTSLSGGGGQQKLLHVPEAHWDGITDLISLWPDLLISSGREGVIKLWKVC
uniref:non-specific serine/threonine protein kinase n=1 Tax=Meloidogyne incognita TaxID=6306 RepID=A0A914MAF7_MELIC